MAPLDNEIKRRSFLKAGWAWTLVPHALYGSDKAIAASKRCVQTFNTRVCSAEFEFRPQKLAMPLKLSSGIIEEVTEAVATVVVELDDGTHRGVGRGSIYLSDVWAWPHASLPRRECRATLQQVCQLSAQRLPGLTQEESLHPTELGLRLHHWVCEELEIVEDPPPLARAMCSSPLDAAIHDAVGAALGISAFSLYDEPVALPSADPYFPQGGAAAAIATMLCKPRRSFPAWYIVNQSDATKNILAEAVKRYGYFCFKLKISGSDATADATSTSVVYRAARELGIPAPRLTVDSNEANPDAASVMEYLDILESLDSDAYQALEYLEQPTSRDISRAAFDWRPIATRKPVLLDEGLTDLTVLPLAKSQGWSGVALKTCKGHSMLLVSAAWARQHRLLMSLQDLTNPGIALIHAAQLGSRLPTLNGVELNSPQFTPAANRSFLPRLCRLFEPQRGMHRLPDATPVGLGSRM